MGYSNFLTAMGLTYKTLTEPWGNTIVLQKRFNEASFPLISHYFVRHEGYDLMILMGIQWEYEWD